MRSTKDPGLSLSSATVRARSQAQDTCCPLFAKLGMMVVVLIPAWPTSHACDVTQNEITEVAALFPGQGLESQVSAGSPQKITWGPGSPRPQPALPVRRARHLSHRPQLRTGGSPRR